MPIEMLQGGGKKPKWKARVGEIVTIYLDPRTETRVEGPAKLVGRRRSKYADVSGLEFWTVEGVDSPKYPGVWINGQRYIKGRG